MKNLVRHLVLARCEVLTAVTKEVEFVKEVGLYARASL